MLYVRMVQCEAYLYGYNMHDDKWHAFWIEEESICESEENIPPSSPMSESSSRSSEYDDDKLSPWTYDNEPSPLTARTGNLLKASWSNGCVIVDNRLYRFQMFRYPKDELRSILIIHDLEHEIEVQTNAVELDYVDSIHFPEDPPIEGSWEVDISHVVHEDVLHDNFACGDLVYQGKITSCLRLSLVIEYERLSYHHVCTCMFDLELNHDKAAAVGQSSFIAKPSALEGSSAERPLLL